MIKERITRQDIDAYKREILEQTVVVTMQAAAQMLACSTSTVRSLVREGRIGQYTRHDHGRPCAGTRILASELREYVRSIRVTGDRWNE